MSGYERVTRHDDGDPDDIVWVGDGLPEAPIDVVEPDPSWPAQFDELAGRIRRALAARVLSLEHVGSTSVPGLPAKPVVDIDLTVADSNDEQAYVPALDRAGFRLRIRERSWHEHPCSWRRHPVATCTCGAQIAPRRSATACSATGCAPTPARP